MLDCSHFVLVLFYFFCSVDTAVCNSFQLIVWSLCRFISIPASFWPSSVQSALISSGEVLQYLAWWLHSILLQFIALPAEDVLPPISGSDVSHDVHYRVLANYPCHVNVRSVFSWRLFVSDKSFDWSITSLFLTFPKVTIALSSSTVLWMALLSKMRVSCAADLDVKVPTVFNRNFINGTFHNQAD